ncbi:Asp-tRNA(Asn)/Glu-tRNA(Gln) amidotransferase subunit GatA [bacterium]|nr:Asp-tRNA(Asn)/Glu-tRNA(Gln) amidotransferase subunit GatA [bacterium]
MKLYQLTAHQAHQLLNDRKISCQELVNSVIERIKTTDPEINAYITKFFDQALKQAEIIDRQIKNKEELHPLTGIPIAVKDNICIKGTLTTCGSKILNNYYAPYDATVIEKLKAVGAIFIGKTNMDEFAMGSSNETSYYGPVKNPWEKERIPGGSSGGSAACLAADEAILALGSDTGGSIRQPAALCGVVGLKPTYGLVSRYGLIAFASSLDQIGPLTKDVTDLAILLNTIAGHDLKDTTSQDCSIPDYTRFLDGEIKGIKIGIPKEYFTTGIQEEVMSNIKQAIAKLEELGAHCLEISLPHTEYAVATYYLICTAEASSNLARYDGIEYGYRYPSNDLMQMYRETRKEGFGAEVKRRITLGTFVLSAGYYDAYFLKAQKVRTLIKEDFNQAFKCCNLILTPTTPTIAFKIGEKFNHPLSMYLSDIFTISANLAGIPGISVPCGYAHHLPVGIQFLAPYFSETLLIKVAYTLEQNNFFEKESLSC